MESKKGSISIGVIIAIIVVALGVVGGIFYYIKTQQTTPPTNNDTVLQTNETGNWKIYQNTEYGFTFKYPSGLSVRDGIKDNKPLGLLNFYQLCGEIVTTPEEPALGPDDNFVGYCKNEFFKIEVWEPSTNLSQINTDFSMLELTETNAMTIGDMPASDLVYAGKSNVDGASHAWHLFVVEAKGFIYSMRGDYCMDNAITTCNQILSTFQFAKTQQIDVACRKEENCCTKNDDCKYIRFTGKCNTPEYVAEKQKEAEAQGIGLGEAPKKDNVTCTCENAKCVTHN